MTPIKQLILVVSVAWLGASPALADDAGPGSLKGLGTLRSTSDLFTGARAGNQRPAPTGPVGSVRFLHDPIPPSLADEADLAGLPSDGGATPDGRKYKMLVAPVILDADNGPSPQRSPNGPGNLTLGPNVDADSGAPVRQPCCRGSFNFTITASGSAGSVPTSFANDPRAVGLAPKGPVFAAPSSAQFNEGGVTGFTRKVIGNTK